MFLKWWGSSCEPVMVLAADCRDRSTWDPKPLPLTYWGLQWRNDIRGCVCQCFARSGWLAWLGWFSIVSAGLATLAYGFAGLLWFDIGSFWLPTVSLTLFWIGFADLTLVVMGLPNWPMVPLNSCGFTVVLLGLQQSLTSIVLDWSLVWHWLCLACHTGPWFFWDPLVSCHFQMACWFFLAFGSFSPVVVFVHLALASLSGEAMAGPLATPTGHKQNVWRHLVQVPVGLDPLIQFTQNLGGGFLVNRQD